MPGHWCDVVGMLSVAATIAGLGGGCFMGFRLLVVLPRCWIHPKCCKVCAVKATCMGFFSSATCIRFICMSKIVRD